MQTTVLRPVAQGEHLRDARDAYLRLIEWMAAEHFRGHDPYDGLTTRWNVLTRARWSRLATVYLNKLSPLNLRPLFGIPKEYDHQALGLIVSAALRWPRGAEAVPVDSLVQRILAGSLRTREGLHCWNGHPFPVQMRHYYRPPDVPEVIGTEACATALMDLRRVRGADPVIDEVLREVRSFCLERLFTRFGEAAFFHYSTTTAAHLCTYNASMIAARLVLEVNEALGEDEGCAEVDAAARFVVDRQHADGRWMYRIDLRTGSEKAQIDFHQGFIIDALLRYSELRPGVVPGLGCAIRRGLEFYRTRQFLPNGRGLHRYPRRWPSNIQNQAQAILTFARAGRWDPALAAFSDRVVAWTLRNMQLSDGSFSYLKYPVGANRVRYLRWSCASMAFALAEYCRAAEAE